MSDAPLELQLATARAEVANVYRECAHLVAYLSAVLPASLSYSDPGTLEWPVLTVQGPTGQMSWHIAPEDVELFGHLGLDVGEFPGDGHSTEEKYQRLDALTRHTHTVRTTPQAPPPPRYPYPDGDVTVLGPGIFASLDRAVITWDGQNYVPAVRHPKPQEAEQAAQEPEEPAPAPKRRGRPRKTAQAAPEASQTVLEG